MGHSVVTKKKSCGGNLVSGTVSAAEACGLAAWRGECAAQPARTARGSSSNSDRINDDGTGYKSSGNIPNDSKAAGAALVPKYFIRSSGRAGRSDKRIMSFDPLVANPGRLSILTALAVEERQEFVDLRHRTRLTDGNLAAHAKRLQGGGLIEIDKQFRDNKPVTTFVLTPDGRKALEGHVRRLMSALSQRRVPGTAVADAAPPSSRERLARREAVEPNTVAVAEPLSFPDHEEWVD